MFIWMHLFLRFRFLLMTLTNKKKKSGHVFQTHDILQVINFGKYCSRTVFLKAGVSVQIRRGSRAVKSRAYSTYDIVQQNESEKKNSLFTILKLNTRI